MLPVILIAVMGAVGVKVAGSISPERRTRLLNNLDEFAAAAGVIGRLMSAVDGFRSIVAWQDTLTAGERNRAHPPLGVPLPTKIEYEPARGTRQIGKRPASLDDDDWDDYDLEDYR